MGVVMEKRRTIGVGVVSLGWMGRLHTCAYKALAEKFPEIDVNIRLVSCCDVVAETEGKQWTGWDSALRLRTTTISSAIPK